ATTPWLLAELMWAPEMPTKALMILKPDCCSAFWTDAVIACIASSTSTTTPRRIPRDGVMPAPMISSWSSGDTAAIKVQTLVVPTSIPTTIRSRAIYLSRSSLEPRGSLANIWTVLESKINQLGVLTSAVEIPTHRHQRGHLPVEIVIEAKPYPCSSVSYHRDARVGTILELHRSQRRDTRQKLLESKRRHQRLRIDSATSLDRLRAYVADRRQRHRPVGRAQDTTVGVDEKG